MQHEGGRGGKVPQGMGGPIDVGKREEEGEGEGDGATQAPNGCLGTGEGE